MSKDMSVPPKAAAKKKKKKRSGASGKTYAKSTVLLRKTVIQWHMGGMKPKAIMEKLKEDFPECKVNPGTMSGWLYKPQFRKCLEKNLEYVAKGSGLTVTGLNDGNKELATDSGVPSVGDVATDSVVPPPDADLDKDPATDIVVPPTDVDPATDSIVPPADIGSMTEEMAKKDVAETENAEFNVKNSAHFGYLRRMQRRTAFKGRCRLQEPGSRCRWPKVEVILRGEVEKRIEYNTTRDMAWIKQRAKELWAQEYKTIAGMEASARSALDPSTRQLFAASTTWYNAFMFRNGFDDFNQTTARQVSLEEFVTGHKPWLEEERAEWRRLGLTIFVDGVEYADRSKMDNLDEIPIQCYSKRKSKQLMSRRNPVQVQVWTIPATRDCGKRICTFYCALNPTGWTCLDRSNPWAVVNPCVILPAGAGQLPETETKQYAKHVKVYSNPKAWMDTAVWNDWAHEYASEIGHRGARMLYVDNLSSHLDSATTDYLKGEGIHIRCGNPHTTDKWQPWDRHIGRYIQCHVHSRGFRKYVGIVERKYMKEMDAAKAEGRRCRTLPKSSLRTLRVMTTRWAFRAYRSLVTEHLTAVWSAFMPCGLLLPFDGSLDDDYWAAILLNQKGALEKVHSRVFDSPLFERKEVEDVFDADDEEEDDSKLQTIVQPMAAVSSAAPMASLSSGEPMAALSSAEPMDTIRVTDASLYESDDSSEDEPLIPVRGKRAVMGTVKCSADGAEERGDHKEMSESALALRGFESLQRRIKEYGYISSDAADEDWSDEDSFVTELEEFVEVVMTPTQKRRLAAIKKMNVVTLKSALRENGLPTTGLKKDLQERLVSTEFGAVLPEDSDDDEFGAALPVDSDEDYDDESED